MTRTPEESFDGLILEADWADMHGGGHHDDNCEVCRDIANVRTALETAAVSQPAVQTTVVTDEMVERAWAAIVGNDIAGMCFQVSIIRADLRTGLEAVIPAQGASSCGGVPERETFWLLERHDGAAWAFYTSYSGSFVHSYTEDVWQAGRFKNERHAHDVWRSLEKAERARWKPVEHMFINKVQDTSSVPSAHREGGK